ncbi:L-fuconolactonase [Parapedobacter composti]|uniref:L-fuconolactonase n=1 Tax=Parapedobacter composti TaxID=623281 RepID=A0A1I1L060_9SPHI|nr:amidohydrolase family protein [Parapedobacter composti]SFC66371.1 L-fuconolactonase [Parapedobacter composti]
MTIVNTNDYPIRFTDSHVHFWDLALMHYPWLADVPAINRSFGLAEYRRATAGIPIEKLIFVQCECLPHQYGTEVDYVCELGALDPRIVGIVAYFPLEEADAEARLQELSSSRLVKGIRRLEEEPDSLYDNPTFIRNLALLNTYNFSFDLCVKAHQLPAAVRLVQRQPGNRYVLDHFGKPAIRAGSFPSWKSHIVELAKNPSVYCKLSGLVTEADWNRWTLADLQPYVETVLEHFGAQRVLFGGDWPVVTLAASYRQWLETALRLCEQLTPEERHQVFYQNALTFYQID